MEERVIEGFRLSPQQRHLWLSRPNAAANVCVVLIEGGVDLDRLKRAVQDVVDRYEILRTGFHSHAGIKFPFQAVVDGFTPPWETHDLTQLAKAEQEAEVDKLFREQQSAAPSPEEPSLRLSLIVLSDSRHLLVVSISSLCCDSITFDNFVQELGDRYGEPFHAKDETAIVQYADYSGWIEELLEKEDHESVAGRAYWQKRNEFPVDPIALPFKLRDAGRKYVAARIHCFDSGSQCGAGSRKYGSEPGFV